MNIQRHVTPVKIWGLQWSRTCQDIPFIGEGKLLHFELEQITARGRCSHSGGNTFHTWEYRSAHTWGEQDVDEEGAAQALELTAAGIAARAQEQYSVRTGSHLPGQVTYTEFETFIWCCGPLCEEHIGLGARVNHHHS